MSKILVIGDHIKDKYVFGKVERISPEAPVPVFKKTREETRVGGAGNVAQNIESLGGHLYYFHAPKEITKTRYISDSHHLLRVDEEDITKHIYTNHESKSIISTAKYVDIIAIQDYGKGTITQYLMDLLKPYKHKILVDPIPVNRDLYRGVNLITPNDIEVKQMTGEIDYIKGARKLVSDLETKVLVTRGEKGMTLVTKDEVTEYPTIKSEIRDVTGAGDTVLATLAVYLSEGKSLDEAIKQANKAAGIVITKLGTYAVKRNEIEKI